MSNHIYYRIVGNAVAFSMHSINSISMLTAIQDEILLKDPQIKSLASMQSRFLTIWNIAFQMVYAGLALTCDILTIMNKDHLLPKPIKKFRDTFFSSIVYPGTLLVFTIFWPIFLYDRSLVFPEFIDKVFSINNNYVMHLAILPFVLWELAFQPRNEPKSHLTNVANIVIYYAIYNIHISITYFERGVWPYPLMDMLYGTMYFFYCHVICFAMIIAFYYLQWPLCAIIWGKENKISEKIK